MRFQGSHEVVKDNGWETREEVQSDRVRVHLIGKINSDLRFASDVF